MASVLPGTIFASASPNAPIGYLPCDGGLYNKTSFSELYRVIGDTYGTSTEGSVSQIYATGVSSTVLSDTSKKLIDLFSSELWNSTVNDVTVTFDFGTSDVLINGLVLYMTGTTQNPTEISIQDATGAEKYKITQGLSGLEATITLSSLFVGKVMKLQMKNTSTVAMYEVKFFYKEPGQYFRVPDMRGRCAVGVLPKNTERNDNNGKSITPKLLGETGGEEAHILTMNEMPAHYHGLGNHSHGYNRRNRGSGAYWAYDIYSDSPGITYDKRVSNSENLWNSGESGVIAKTEGMDMAHNNMMPSIYLNYYIKF